MFQRKIGCCREWTNNNTCINTSLNCSNLILIDRHLLCLYWLCVFNNILSTHIYYVCPIRKKDVSDREINLCLFDSIAALNRKRLDLFYCIPFFILFIYLFVYLFVCLFVLLFVYLFVCLYVCLFLYFSLFFVC